MRNTGLEEAQPGIKIAGRNINNIRPAGDTTLMEESEELKSLLMKVKEESEKVGFKLKIQKTKIMAFGPITSWEIDGQKVETVLTLIFWAPKSATDFLRMDWLDLLAVQGTLKSLLQHHSSKASNLQCSAFFIVQLSHPYMTTGKTIALTRWTFVDKVMSLLLNMLSRLVITFLPRSKCLLISWLQSPSAVILEPKKIKSDTVSTVSPSICHEVMGPDAMILVF